MAARFTPGKVIPSKPKPPQGQSHKTLTIKVKAHTRKVAAKPAQAKAPASYLDAPITPGSSITYRQAQRQAANAVKVRYGSQEQGVGQQIAAQQQTGAAQQDWFKQYEAQLAQAQTDTANRAAATNTAVQQQADSIRSLDQGQLTQQQQAMNTDAANRGATVDPNVANRDSQASVVRQALEGGLGALIAQHGLTASNQAGNLAHVVAPIQQGQAQAANASKVGSLKEQLTGLKGQEGAYAQSFIDSLTSSEAKNLLAAAIAGQGYNLKSQTLKETHRRDTLSSNNAKARLNATKTANATKVNQYGYSNADWQKMTPAQRQTAIHQFKQNTTLKTPGKGPGAKKPTQGPGSLTSGQESHVVQAVKGARAAALTLMSKPNAASGEVRQLLAAGKVDGIKYTHDEINAAFDLLPTKYGGLGGLSPANVKALHRMGIHVNGVFPILKVSGAQALAQTVGVKYTGPN